MALKNLLQTMKTDTVLVGELNRYLLKPNAGSGFVKDERATGVWHPSSLAGCPRALVFGMERIPATGSKINALTRRIFDTGHHFGYMIQEYLYNMGILYGEWQCRECKHRWTDLFDNPSPSNCPSCGEKLYIWYNLDYLEVPVRDEEYNITGHSDGIIKTLGKYRVLELKTIKNRTKGTHPKSNTYDDLSAPQDAHLKQVMLYTYIINKEAEKQLKKVEDAIVLYGAKNDQGLKEFRVKLLHDLYVQPQLDKIKEMDAHIEKRTVPRRPAGCVNKNSWDCKFCGFRDICYLIESDKIEDYRKLGEK